MNVPLKLAAFGAALVATFAISYGVGNAVGPVGDNPPAPSTATTTSMVMNQGAHP